MPHLPVRVGCNRLNEQNLDKNVHFMSPMICMCSTMFRINPQQLLWVLENLVAGNVVNRITVPAEEADYARLALQRMFDVTVALD